MRHAIQRLLHYSVNTKTTANQKCHACRICLNSLLCFTTTDSLTWQRTELHKELFNLRHTAWRNKPAKAINTKRVIPRNLIEATLNSFQQEPASLSKQRKTKLKLPKTPLTICSLGNRAKATLSQPKFQHSDEISN